MRPPQSGIYPVIVIFLNREERDRLIAAMVQWPNVPTRVLTFREPHDGQVQFILLEPETCSGTEGTKVDPTIIGQIGDGPQENGQDTDEPDGGGKSDAE